MLTVNGLVAAVTAAGTPQPLSGTLKACRRIIINPGKASGAGQVANTGNIYIGSSAMNKNTGAGVLLVVAKTSAPIQLEDILGNGFDLSIIYIDADTTADGAYVGFIL